MSAAKKKLDTDLVATELSESAFFQPASPQVDKTTSVLVDKPINQQVSNPASWKAHKPTKPQIEKPTTQQNRKTTSTPVVKYTTHLRSETIKAIKQYSLDHDEHDYDIVQEALDYFFSLKD